MARCRAYGGVPLRILEEGCAMSVDGLPGSGTTGSDTDPARGRGARGARAEWVGAERARAERARAERARAERARAERARAERARAERAGAERARTELEPAAAAGILEVPTRGAPVPGEAGARHDAHGPGKRPRDSRRSCADPSARAAPAIPGCAA